MSGTPVTAAGECRLSLVVPCYNRAAYLNVLLRSLTWSRVDPREFEVIVVNDGGVDHVDLVAEGWRRRGLDVRVHHLRPRGEPRNNARARNAGTHLARYPIVIQTDPDIVYVSDVLLRVREHLVPGTFCSVSGYYPLTREATLALAFGENGPGGSAADLLNAARGRPNQVVSPDGVGGLHGAFACTKDDLLRVGGYDESFEYWGWEDRELLVSLTQGLGLTRRHLPHTSVVHLWHPQLRGETWREKFAVRELISRVAWDIQMQRAAAEYPRDIRPRRLSPAPEIDRDARVFTTSAWSEWSDAAANATSTPLSWRWNFTAHRLEAMQLRSQGFPALARAFLYCGLQAPWEHPYAGTDWRAHAVPPPADDRAALAARWQHYDDAALALDELAACERACGDDSGYERALRLIDALPSGSAAICALRTRDALAAGDLPTARQHAAGLRGRGWTPDRAALGVEVALRSGDPERAARIVLAAGDGDTVEGDYFERLRLAAYARSIAARVSEPSATMIRARFNGLLDDRSEFLYSAALRSLRAELRLGASLLLEAFVEGAAPAEPRLHADAHTRLASIRATVHGVVPGVRHIAPARTTGDATDV